MENNKEEFSDLKARHEALIQQTLISDPTISRGCASLMAARQMLRQVKEEIFGTIVVDVSLKKQGGNGW